MSAAVPTLDEFEALAGRVEALEGSVEAIRAAAASPAPSPAPGYVLPSVVAGSAPVGSTSYTIPAGSLFVDAATGSDSAAGTFAAPLHTVERAIALVAAGGTIVLRGGEYHEGRSGGQSSYAGITLTKAGVTIQSYPGEAVWFVGASRVTSWSSGGGYWSASFATALNRSASWSFDTSASFAWSGRPYAANAEQVWLDGTALTYVATTAELGPGKFTVTGTLSGYTFTASAYHIGEDPTGRDVRIGDLQTALTLVAPDCTLRGVGAKFYVGSVAHSGVFKSARNRCGFENVLVQDCLQVGIHQLGGGSAAAPDGVDQWLRNVTAIRCGMIGLSSNNANNLNYYRVRAEYANWRGFANEPASGCAKLTRQRGTVIRESVFSHSYTGGIWFDEMVAGVDLINVDVCDNAVVGVHQEISGLLRMVNCLVSRNGFTGIHIMSSSITRIWNCTVTGNGWKPATEKVLSSGTEPLAREIRWNLDSRAPVRSSSTNRDARYPIPDPDGITWEVQSAQVRNCILGGGASIYGHQALVDDRRSSGVSKAWTTAGLDWDNNLYSRPTGSGGLTNEFSLAQGGSTAETHYATLAALKNATASSGQAQEASSLAYDSVTVLTSDLSTLLDTYRAPADAAAAPLPADLAALAATHPGAARMGAWR